MPSGTKFVAIKNEDMTSQAVHFDAQGVSAIMPAGVTTNLDYTLTDDCELTGLNLIVNGAVYGDYACLQIVDVSGAFTGVPGTVLNQFVTNWYLASQSDLEFETPYPAKVLTGMTVRIVFTSTGTADSFVAINYRLHKILA